VQVHRLLGGTDQLGPGCVGGIAHSVQATAGEPDRLGGRNAVVHVPQLSRGVDDIGPALLDQGAVLVRNANAVVSHWLCVGFSRPPRASQTSHSRSTLQWCSQKTGSSAARLASTMSPPRSPWMML
jgi:hypothetical protein